MSLDQNEIIIGANIVIFVLMNLMYLINSTYQNKYLFRIYTCITIINIIIGLFINFVFFKIFNSEVAIWCSSAYVVASFLCKSFAKKMSHSKNNKNETFYI